MPPDQNYDVSSCDVLCQGTCVIVSPPTTIRYCGRPRYGDPWFWGCRRVRIRAVGYRGSCVPAPLIDPRLCRCEQGSDGPELLDVFTAENCDPRQR